MIRMQRSWKKHITLPKDKDKDNIDVEDGLDHYDDVEEHVDVIDVDEPPAKKHKASNGKILVQKKFRGIVVIWKSQLFSY